MQKSTLQSSSQQEKDEKFTRILVFEEQMDSRSKSRYQFERIFAVRCFSPKLCFDRIVDEKPHSIILASGTLSPMDSLSE